MNMEVDIHSIAALPGFVPRLYLVIEAEVDLERSKANGEASSSSEGFLFPVEEV